MLDHGTMAAAGPSRLPYVELPAPSSSSGFAAAAARVSTADFKTSSHGSTTQESSSGLANGKHAQNGIDHASDDSDDEEVARVSKSSATYSTSGAIVHRAFRPRTGNELRHNSDLVL